MHLQESTHSNSQGPAVALAPTPTPIGKSVRLKTLPHLRSLHVGDLSAAAVIKRFLGSGIVLMQLRCTMCRQYSAGSRGNACSSGTEGVGCQTGLPVIQTNDISIK